LKTHEGEDLTITKGEDLITLSSAEWENLMKPSSTGEEHRTFRIGLLLISFNVMLTVRVEVVAQ
jgi:hypothetical protein